MYSLFLITFFGFTEITYDNLGTYASLAECEIANELEYDYRVIMHGPPHPEKVAAILLCTQRGVKELPQYAD